MARKNWVEMAPGRQTVVIAMLVIVLLGNILMLGRSLNLFYLPGEKNALELAKENSFTLISYIERWANEQGLSGLQSVRDLVARLQYDVSRSRSLEELAQVMLNGGASAKEILDMERAAKRREVLQNLINDDPGIARVRQKITINISNEQGTEVSVHDPAGVLSEQTITAIKEHPLCSLAFDNISIEVVDGTAKAVNIRSLYDQVKALQQETQTLQAELRSIKSLAGFASVTGAGVRLKLYDSPGGYTSGDIVHDTDIRDIVNELFAAGAVAVSVGGQRLTTTSSIRCVGPVVLVNQKQIVVNPVVIEAVGDPEVLFSSMDLIINTFTASRGIVIEVEKEAELTLPAAVSNL
ncbi:MAG: DUF881 domain-containing protein [Firmicutes bacterium]|nr:DUF881 domain-containing protein [Bacillota bacterium]